LGAKKTFIIVILPRMRKIFLSIILIAGGFQVEAQQIIDKVIGVVGKYPILKSDLQNMYMERENQEAPFDRCKSFEMLVYQKLLVAQADRDSVVVSDSEVDTELSRRMAYFISQFGSEAKLEEFYGKRSNVIKDELRPDVMEQLVAEKMSGTIAGEIKLSPAEVRQFYNSVPQDSLPLIESEVELQQLVKKPSASAEAKAEAKEFLESLRQRVLKGENMSTMARLYSEDPASAREGGLYNNIGKGQFDPAFEAVMFRLKKGEISTIFESAYGYHFVELVARRGELVDVRHILVIPKVTNDDYVRSKKQLDSLQSEITKGTISFEEAVRKFSDDSETRQNGGLMVNPATASTKFDNEILSQLDKNMIATLNTMRVGDVSKAMQFTAPDGKPGFRMLKLKNRIDPHRTNMKDDYQKLNLLATDARKKELIREWIKKRSKITYIKLDPDYMCKFENEWTISN
jgi:peptidyl-prolyl cis-trans isomerase SurA